MCDLQGGGADVRLNLDPARSYSLRLRQTRARNPERLEDGADGDEQPNALVDQDRLAPDGRSGRLGLRNEPVGLYPGGWPVRRCGADDRLAAKGVGLSEGRLTPPGGSGDGVTRKVLGLRR